MTLLHQAAQKAVEALNHAQQWIGSAPHGDNCYVSDHYEGDPGDRCNCGKESALSSVECALSALQQQPEPMAPFWYAVVSDEAPIINKAIRRADVAEEYAQNCRENGYTRVQVVPLYAASPSTTQQQEAGNGWIGVNECLPELGTECLVYGPHWFSETPCIRMDCWDEQREALVSFSSLTTPVGAGWCDSAFEEVTHWMPLPAAPSTPESAEKDDAGGVSMDDRIEAWHNGAGDGKPLHEFLGMTPEQYAEWVRNPDGVPASRSLPHPGSPEASAMLDSLLAEYNWPANPKNAARAGWEAAERWLRTPGVPASRSEPTPPRGNDGGEHA